MKYNAMNKKGFRLLSSSEVERVSGGFGFEADDGPPIVVDGRRYTGLTVDQLLGLIDDGAFDGYVDGTGDLGGGSGDDGPPIVVNGDKIESDCEEHRKAAEDALDALYNGSQIARDLIDTIRASGVTINTGSFNNSGAGQQAGFDPATNTIHWDPFQAAQGTNNDGSTYTLSPFMILAHELIHAANRDNPDFQGHSSEPNVIPLANQIAEEYNAANGTNYDTSRDSHIRDVLYDVGSTFSVLFSIADTSCND